MTESDSVDFDELSETLFAEQEEATHNGNIAKAQRIEKQIRSMFVKRYGTGPAVGSSGGPTA